MISHLGNVHFSDISASSAKIVCGSQLLSSSYPPDASAGGERSSRWFSRSATLFGHCPGVPLLSWTERQHWGQVLAMMLWMIDRLLNEELNELKKATLRKVEGWGRWGGRRTALPLWSETGSLAGNVQVTSPEEEDGEVVRYPPHPYHHHLSSFHKMGRAFSFDTIGQKDEQTGATSKPERCLTPQKISSIGGLSAITSPNVKCQRLHNGHFQAVRFLYVISIQFKTKTDQSLLLQNY